MIEHTRVRHTETQYEKFYSAIGNERTILTIAMRKKNPSIILYYYSGVGVRAYWPKKLACVRAHTSSGISVMKTKRSPEWKLKPHAKEHVYPWERNDLFNLSSSNSRVCAYVCFSVAFCPLQMILYGVGLHLRFPIVTAMYTPIVNWIECDLWAGRRHGTSIYGRDHTADWFNS